MSKFRVGDRVRPTSKAWGVEEGWLSTSEILIVKKAGADLCVTTTKYANYYDDFDAFELVTTKGDKPMARRTFKLVKATPDYKVGALFQEACDDGDQEFVLLTRELLMFPDANKDNEPSYERVEVIDQPQWFVEVFKVTPEYMTQPELDRFTAFKKALSPANKPAKRKYTKRAKVAKK